MSKYVTINDDGSATVRTPYSPEVIRLCKAASGRWDANTKTWRIAAVSVAKLDIEQINQWAIAYDPVRILWPVTTNIRIGDVFSTLSDQKYSVVKIGNSWYQSPPNPDDENYCSINPDLASDTYHGEVRYIYAVPAADDARIDAKADWSDGQRRPSSQELAALGRSDDMYIGDA